MSQNTFKIVWCIENKNINIQSNIYMYIPLFVNELRWNMKIATW